MRTQLAQAEPLIAGRRCSLSECLKNEGMPVWSGVARGLRRVVRLRWTGADPVFPMCEDQKDTRARACPGYAPGQRAGQGLSQ